jgi:hypothetical protein
VLVAARDSATNTWSRRQHLIATMHPRPAPGRWHSGAKARAKQAGGWHSAGKSEADDAKGKAWPRVLHVGWCKSNVQACSLVRACSMFLLAW